MNEILELANSNPIFSTAIAIVFIIGVLEGVLSLIGAGMSSMLDSIMPELDIEIDMPDSGISTFSEVFGWLNKGRVPMLMIVLTFLTSFGLIGLITQFIWFSISGSYLYTLLVLPIAIIGSLPVVRIFSVILSKIMPRDETTAISTDQFIGGICTIVSGKASSTNFVEAKFKDQFNETHYIMVKSLNENETFEAKSEAFIHSKISEKRFLIIKTPN